MAGYTSRIFLTLTVPSIFGFLSILWYLKRKNTNSKINKVIEIEETPDIPDQYQFLYPMKLKQQEVPSDEKVCAEMQLKETETIPAQQSNGISQNPKSKGKKKKTKVYENGNSCLPDEPQTNGHGKDNYLLNGDKKVELTNGIKALSLSNGVSKMDINNKTVAEMEVGDTVKVLLNDANNSVDFDPQPTASNGVQKDTCSTSKSSMEGKLSSVEGLDVAKEKCDIDKAHHKCSSNSHQAALEESVCPKISSSTEGTDTSAEVLTLSDSMLNVTNLLSLPDTSKAEDTDEHSSLSDSGTNDGPSESITELYAVTENTYQLTIDVSGGEELMTPSIGYLVADTNSDLAPVDYVVTDELLPVPVSYAAATAQGDMLESPVTTYCDSLGSNDSGRGASEIQFALGAESSSSYMVYEFEIMPEDCGRLIGKNGKHVKYINNQTNASILIRKHPLHTEKKLCSVTGNENEINAALKLIRKRFPIEEFPNVTLAQLNAVPLQVQCPETLKLPLPEGGAFEALLCATIHAGHFFLQQPTHPTFHQLLPLTNAMTQFYSDYLMEAPMIDNLTKGNVCAAGISLGWFRAEIDEVYSADECRVKFLDYGGYADISKSAIRQIRGEFLTIPFQATECFLAGVAPLDESGWNRDSTSAFEDLAQGQFLQGCIVAYSDNKVPYVNLYKITGATSVFINHELIKAGFASGISLLQ